MTIAYKRGIEIFPVYLSRKTKIASRIVLPNCVKKRTRFKANLFVTNGTRKLAKKEDRPIRIGTREVEMTEPDKTNTFAITTTLKKTSARFAIPCESISFRISFDINTSSLFLFRI